MKSDEVRGHLDALILAALSESPAHGYNVIEQIRARTGGSFDLAEGTVYPALHRLEADGHLTSTWTDVQGRRRKIYSVTKPGRKQLAAERDRWHRFSSTITKAIGGLPA